MSDRSPSSVVVIDVLRRSTSISPEAMKREPFSVYVYPAPEQKYEPERTGRKSWTHCYGATRERARELIRAGATFIGHEGEAP